MSRRPDDDYEDRPRRRDDDYDDLDRPRRRRLTGMDAFFGNTNTVVLVLFGFCCGYIALVLGIVGLATCKDAKAKQNALVVTVISGVMSVIGTGANIARFALHR